MKTPYHTSSSIFIVLAICLLAPPSFQTNITIESVGNIATLSPRPSPSSIRYSLDVSFSNLEFYYYDEITRLFEREQTRNAARIMEGRIALIIQFYLPDDERKRREMLATLQLNLFSPFVHRVYLLQEQHNATLEKWILDRVAVPHAKLEFHPISGGGRAKFSDMVDLANTHVARESERMNKTLLVAAANNDNLLVSASMLNLADFFSVEWARTLIPISRVYTFEPLRSTYTRSQRTPQNMQKCRHKTVVGSPSADVFLFIPPLDYKHTGADFDVYMGTSHIEDFVFWQMLLHVPEWGIFNPCRWVNVYHNHRYRTPATGETIYRDISMIKPPYLKLAYPSHRFDSRLRYTNRSIHHLMNYGASTHDLEMK